MAKRKVKINKRLFKQAKTCLVGGVDSPVRSFGYVGGDPVLIKSGRGSKVYDYDGNAYIDYVLSWGAAILGHAHPFVVRRAIDRLRRGAGFGTTNSSEVELAGAIKRAIPFVEKIRFVNSGTEAVMGAVRLARGYTKRDKILKFESSYHGHADYLLAKGGSGLATLGIPSSAGVPEDFIRHTLIAPIGDFDKVESIFRKYGPEIAAVIIEPVGANYGVLKPDADFLKKLRRITKRYGALLIFDEVITGFRFGFGTIAGKFDITSDIICLGKIIGGGLPVGAYGGSAAIMDNLAPLGKVYQASTFSGNPVVMEAGLATLKTLERHKKEYARTEDLARYLTANLKEEAAGHGISLEISSYGNIFSIKFKNKEQFKQFYRLMLRRGVYFAPSEYEANFLSLAHTKRDIDKTIAAATWAFGRVKR